ncbi:hypothetical protein [Noviherbaspirillum galbum]|uniref:Uncharacterized protein n=1 Tax=Noviherbaspirillum galbum TaxID=2709383 RepID=A0A6B3SH31_9BURK|nr:hypothetical protein [Noviherbaspirillum galbum]NEX60154.1 hypothetical protein [Noviherbaspirillum galbum]
MVEFLAVVLAFGAYWLGYKLGRADGQKEVLIDLRARMRACVQNLSGPLSKWNISGGLVDIDFYGDSPHGVGYLDGPFSPSFMIVNEQELEKKLSERLSLSRESTEQIEVEDPHFANLAADADSEWESTNAYIGELDRRLGEMSQEIRDRPK